VAKNRKHGGKSTRPDGAKTPKSSIRAATEADAAKKRKEKLDDKASTDRAMNRLRRYN
jgi:hypothetical protein